MLRICMMLCVFLRNSIAVLPEAWAWEMLWFHWAQMLGLLHITLLLQLFINILNWLFHWAIITI